MRVFIFFVIEGKSEENHLLEHLLMCQELPAALQKLKLD